MRQLGFCGCLCGYVHKVYTSVSRHVLALMLGTLRYFPRSLARLRRMYLRDWSGDPLKSAEVSTTSLCCSDIPKSNSNPIQPTTPSPRQQHTELEQSNPIQPCLMQSGLIFSSASTRLHSSKPARICRSLPVDVTSSTTADVLSHPGHTKLKIVYGPRLGPTSDTRRYPVFRSRSRFAVSHTANIVRCEARRSIQVVRSTPGAASNTARLITSDVPTKLEAPAD
ncbi:hypothetical protein F4677DRAFT_326436 [Hypoxylon crocopeplum]|nr:hypothetical protein F4677DRAFT_326436 [Hypoxylon crocopeplum]